MKAPFNIQVEAIDLGDKGLSIARDAERQIYLVEHMVPGDVGLIEVYKKHKGMYVGRLKELSMPSPYRDQPFCSHFGVCGGCKWQHMSYQGQLAYKQKLVTDAMQRIGKLEIQEMRPIIGSAKQQFYRNKMEYSFSHKRWLTEDEMGIDDPVQIQGLGFHRPGAFDKVVDIRECWLQDSRANEIRNAVRSFCLENNMPFFDLKNQKGMMRNLLIRNSTIGEWMVCVIFFEDDEEKRTALMNFLKDSFEYITSLQYSINPKKNDSLFGLDFNTLAGNDFITEQLGTVRYKISAKSFFQTNSEQAKVLYDVTAEFAGLSGHEHVYDLYCGTGSIGLYLAESAAHVVGIEEVQAAVDDAEENKHLNEISNATFYAGDVKDILSDDFKDRHGAPDVVITDPPRAGMHEKVVSLLLDLNAPRIVYVSCNPATQARDLAMMRDKYTTTKIQPVDMFPHTSHVENVALLIRNDLL